MISSLYISVSSKARFKSFAFSPCDLRFDLNLCIVISFYHVYVNWSVVF